MTTNRETGPYLKRGGKNAQSGDVQVNIDTLGEAYTQLKKQLDDLVKSAGSAWGGISDAEAKGTPPGPPSLSATGNPYYIEDPAHPGSWIANTATPDPKYWLRENFTVQGAGEGECIPHTLLRVSLAQGTDRSDGEVSIFLGLLVTTPADCDGIHPACTKIMQVVSVLTQADVTNGIADVLAPAGILVGDTVDCIMVAAWNAIGYNETDYATQARRYVAGFGPPLPETPVISSIRRNQHTIKIKLALQGPVDLVAPYNAPGNINYLDSVEVWTRDSTGSGVNPDDGDALVWEQEPDVGIKRIIRKIAQETKAGKLFANQHRSVAVPIQRHKGRKMWGAMRYRDRFGRVGSWANFTPSSVGDDGSTDSGTAPTVPVYSHPSGFNSYKDDVAGTHGRVEASADVYVTFEAGPQRHAKAYILRANGNVIPGEVDLEPNVSVAANVHFERNFHVGEVVTLKKIELLNGDLVETIKPGYQYTIGDGVNIESASATPAKIAPNGTVQFDVSPTGGSSPYTYLWTFHDAATSTLKNPTKTYGAVEGTYPAYLQVTDNLGHVAKTVLYVTVFAAGLPRPPGVPSAGAFTATLEASDGGGAGKFSCLLTVNLATPNPNWQDPATGGGADSVQVRVTDGTKTLWATAACELTDSSVQVQWPDVWKKNKTLVVNKIVAYHGAEKNTVTGTLASVVTTSSTVATLSVGTRDTNDNAPDVYPVTLSGPNVARVAKIHVCKGDAGVYVWNSANKERSQPTIETVDTSATPPSCTQILWNVDIHHAAAAHPEGWFRVEMDDGELGAWACRGSSATPLSAVLTASCAGMVATASAAASGGSGSYPTYRYNWGDGTSDTVVSVPTAQTHTYATSGAKTITLTVTDSLGAFGVDSKTVTPLSLKTCPGWPSVAVSSAWNTPNNATGAFDPDNEILSSRNIPSKTNSGTLALSNPLATPKNPIPDAATIVGVELHIYCFAAITPYITMASLQLLKNGIAMGTDLSQGAPWPSADSELVYGDLASNTWGVALTGADVKASGFGCILSAYNSRTTFSLYAYVDAIEFVVSWYG